MANRNSAGFGFRPSGTLGNLPATQGLSQYWIDSAATVDLFNGMAMKSTGGYICLLYTSPSPRDRTRSRMPSSA